MQPRTSPFFALGPGPCRSGTGLVLVFLLAALVAPPASALSWVVEPVTGSDLGSPRSPSFAFDPLGQPWVAWQENTQDELLLARKRDGVWQVETVDQVGGHAPVLKFDSRGNPMIAYAYLWTGMRFASWTGSTWAREEIAAGNVGDRLSLAVDVNDIPHVVFRDPDNQRLWYSYRDDGWQSEPFFQAAGGAVECAIAVDSAGNPHIAYVQLSPYRLRYATKSGGVWTHETVDDTRTSGLTATSICVDGSGAPHIAYNDGSMGQLAYARRDGGVWSTRIVDPVSGLHTTGYWPALALDSGGRAHIGQVHQGDNEVWYTTGSGTSWSSELVASSYAITSQTSLALDAAERPGIVFLSHTDDLLVYAHGAGNAGVAPRDARAFAFAAGPNPAPLGRTAFSFTLPGGAMRAAVRVVDVAGRHVQVLASRAGEPGPRRLEWDGRTSEGASAPAGVYAALLEIDGEIVATRRVAVLH